MWRGVISAAGWCCTASLTRGSEEVARDQEQAAQEEADAERGSDRSELRIVRFFQGARSARLAEVVDADNDEHDAEEEDAFHAFSCCVANAKGHISMV